MTDNRKYQVKRLELDLRNGNKNNEAEVAINSLLLELQQDSNIEVIDIVETSIDKHNFSFLIKYYDNGLYK